MSIALITPTGGRPSQFNICELLMRRQTYPGKVVWIIIDDCDPVTSNNITADFREGWTIFKEYPNPRWRDGLNTQGRNLSVGINTLLTNYYEDEIEGMFIIEDDDYYRPIYLEEMVRRLQGFRYAGEINTVYYNVFFRRYAVSYTHLTLPTILLV